MKKSDVYDLLRQRVIRYEDLIKISVKDNGERLVPIKTTKHLSGLQTDQSMKAFTGNQIYVRHGVYRLLMQASKSLAAIDGELCLQVVYGYRADSVQKAMFAEAIKKLSSLYSGKKLYAEAHKLIAVPEVAGHPSGGAIDIRILKKGKPIDMGTKVDAFNSSDILVFSPFISTKAWNNRMLLRRVMMNAGFAPFDGEWWHFSYGDKEWAKYYDKAAAIYKQVEFRSKSK